MDDLRQLFASDKDTDVFTEFLALLIQTVIISNPKLMSSTLIARVGSTTHLVLGDRQLSLSGLPRSITSGNSSSPIRRSTLDPIKDGESGVGVSAVVAIEMLTRISVGLWMRRKGEVGGGGEGCGAYRGTKEIPWCTKKGTVVNAVVSCPPCCPAVELQRRRSTRSSSVPRLTRGWKQSGGLGDSREHSSKLSDQSSGCPESTGLVEKGGYLGRGTTVSSGETEEVSVAVGVRREGRGGGLLVRGRCGVGWDDPSGWWDLQLFQVVGLDDGVLGLQ